jgi:hypothetical protein
MWPSARYFEYDAFSLFGIDVQYSRDVGGLAERIVVENLNVLLRKMAY